MASLTRVFISATTGGLRSHRAVVKEVLLSMDILPVEQESFQPNDKTVLEMLREKIASCDAVICLVGLCFGLEPLSRDSGERRRSYTQLEYDIARELRGSPLGTQVFVFLCDENGEYDPPRASDNEDAEKQDLQRAFRQEIRALDDLYETYATKARLRERVALIRFAKRARPRNLPYLSLGALFKGRETSLDEVHRYMSDPNCALGSNVRCLALLGLGGIGKTRAAIEYAWRHLNDYSALLFLQADSPSSLAHSLAELSGPYVLNLKEYQQSEEEVQAAAVIRWLSEQPGWLMVVDNADSPEAAHSVERLLSRLSGGCVLITSRFQGWPSTIQRLELESLDESTSTAFLLEGTHAFRYPHPDDPTAVRSLAALLAGLPLALEQARAYIVHFRCTFDDYIAQWKAHDATFHRWCDPSAMHYPRSLAVTWRVTMDQLSGDSRSLLQLVCWWSPDPIPCFLFEQQAGAEILRRCRRPAVAQFVQRVASALRRRLSTEDQLSRSYLRKLEPSKLGWDAITNLTAFSVVRLDSQQEMFSVHPVVQEMIYLHLPARMRCRSLWSSIEVLNFFAPRTPADVRLWPFWDALRPHVLQCLRHAEAFNIGGRPISRLMNDLATELHAKGLYNEAEPLMRKVLAIDEKALGPNHAIVSIRLNNLARLLQDTNRLDAAEPLIRRAVAIDERTYGPWHPELATKLNNFGMFLIARHELAEAERMLVRALEIDEKYFGRQHTNVARDLGNIAHVMQISSRFREGEPLMRRALAIEEQTYPPDHPNVGRALNNLAHLLETMNQLAAAEPLIRRAVAIEEQSLGPQHPTLGISLINLAHLLQETGRLEEAEQIMRRVITLFEAVHGPDHPDVALALNNLAGLRMKHRDFGEAEQLLTRALTIEEKSWGPNHPSFATSLNNLAHLKEQTGQPGEAEPLIRRALAIDEEALGAVHVNVSRDLTNLSGVLEATNRPQEAEQALRRGLAIVEQLLDRNHSDIASRLGILARFLWKNRRFDEAEPLLRRAVYIRRRFSVATGHEHPQMLETLQAYGELLRASGCSEEEIAQKLALAQNHC